MKTSALRRLACAGLAALGLFAGSATPASAQLVGMRTVASDWSYMALDVAGASTAKFAPVVQWWPTGNANQLWSFDLTDVAASSPVYRFQNVNSHMCLTSNGLAGAEVYQYPCQPNDPNQQWETNMPPFSDLRGRAVRNRASGLCLDVNGASRSPGAKVITWYCNGAGNQAWV